MGSDEGHSPATGQVKEVLGHVTALDGIRGVAILLVLLFHLLWSNFQSGFPVVDFLLAVKGGGWIGVDLFFVLSGFLITGILFDSLGDRRYFRNFYARRALRIFPLYYGSLIVLFLCLALGSHVLATNLGAIGLTTVFMQNTPAYFAHSVGTATVMYTGQFWSLAVEEQYYFVWPLLVFLVRDRVRLMWVAFALALLAPVARVLLVDHGASFAYVYRYTICRQDTLLCGAWLALAVRGPARRTIMKWAVVPFALAMIVAVGMGVHFGRFDYEQDAAINIYGYSVVAIGAMSFLAMVLRAGSISERIMNWKLLRFFGKYSYGIYIFHPMIESSPVGLISHASVFAGLHSKIVTHLVHFICVAGVTVPVAMLSYQFYEKPFLRLKRYFNAEVNAG